MSKLLQILLTRLRRARAAVRLFWADVEVDSAALQLRDAETDGERFALRRRLVAARGKRAIARAWYQATFPPGQRCTWVDA